MNSHPSNSGSGSITDKLMGYVNTAMAKGQEVIEQAKVMGHNVQEQINAAAAQAQAQAAQKTGQAGQMSSDHNNQQQQQYYSAQSANSTTTHAAGTHSTSSGDAFGDLNSFNANAQQQANNAAQQAQHAAGNAGYKSSQGGF